MIIKTDREMFLDLILIYIMDKMNNEDLYPHEEKFDNILKKLKNLSGAFIKHYLDTDVNTRM